MIQVTTLNGPSKECTEVAGEPTFSRSVCPIVQQAGWESFSPPRPVSPEHAVQRYILAAMQRAESRKLEDGTWYVHVPGVNGPWGSSATEADARNEFRGVLEEWIEMKRQDGDRDFPVLGLDGIDLNRLL